jgi:hypothetical protein
VSEQVVRQGFLGEGIPGDLIDALLEAFTEAKRRFYLDDLRPNAVEGGRFSEAAFRILQWATDGGRFTPIGKTLPRVDKLLVTVENGQGNDSLRVHIPRTLRVIYDIRNKRDAAHLADGIDPNFQDATLVVHCMDWIMAEFVRIYNNVPPGEAHEIIVDLVAKDVPIIQEFDGFPRVLKKLKASDHVMVLLYWRGSAGATKAELTTWVRPTMRSHLTRTISRLDENDLVHIAGILIRLTRKGEQHVEQAKLVEPG